ncbi:8547_t:CDS:2, partial [Racocetra fulgida]
ASVNFAISAREKFSHGPTSGNPLARINPAKVSSTSDFLFLLSRFMVICANDVLDSNVPTFP